MIAAKAKGRARAMVKAVALDGRRQQSPRLIQARALVQSQTVILGSGSVVESSNAGENLALQ